MLDKIKSLSKQTLVYGTSQIIGRFLNFILVPFYTNIFPPAEYGVIAVIYSYIAFLNIVYSAGFESGYFKFASTLEIGDEKENFSIPFFTILVNSAFFSLVMLIFSSPLSKLIGIRNAPEIIIYTALILFFDALVIVPFARLRLKNKAKKFAALKITNIVLNVVLNFVLILVFKFGIVAVFISNCCFYYHIYSADTGYLQKHWIEIQRCTLQRIVQILSAIHSCWTFCHYSPGPR